MKQEPNSRDLGISRLQAGEQVKEEVLPTIRKTGQYVAQPYAHNPGDTLSLDQADTLRKLLTDAAKQRHPGDGKQQGAFLMRGWSRLKAMGALAV